MMYGTIAGMYESAKHQSAREAAQFELEEEAHLKSNNWIPLLEESHLSTPVDKYSDNKFFPFLALDCETVINPRPVDNEEYIEIVHNVTFIQLNKLLYTGQINVHSSYGILLALRKLQELKIIP